MSGTAVAVATPVGALVGLGAGWLSVLLERLERLQAEDAEDRATYERELEGERERATQVGQEPPVVVPWPEERYGWTWLEWGLAPALGVLGFAAFAAHESWGGGLAIHLLWVSVFIQIVSFDLKHRLILNKVTYPSIVLALGLSSLSPGLTVGRAAIGCVGVALFFLIQNLVSRGSIGLGDAKLGALVGALCGAGPDASHLGAVYAVIYAVFLGGAVALVLLVLRLRRLKDPIPYGPFLCAGAGLILFQGP